MGAMSRSGRNGRLLSTSWLRAIALGLPLTGASLLGGCSGTGPCPRREVTFPLTPEQLERIQTRGTIDGGALSQCAVSCQEIAGDAGVVSPLERISGCDLAAHEEAGVALVCQVSQDCVGGRRPAGLADARVARSGISGWLARSAHLEAASVPAFLDLARELELHGAPPALARAARRSARDEIRHARALGALARRFGASTPRVERVPTEPRSLVELAHDNAIEGCARETYAALVAVHQSRAARDPFIASTYAGIARDESRHALLSAAIDRWAAERLGARRARAVDDARRDAVAALTSEAERDPRDRAVLGLPDADRAHALAAALA